jgi:hypothetical protein
LENNIINTRIDNLCADLKAFQDVVTALLNAILHRMLAELNTHYSQVASTSDPGPASYIFPPGQSYGQEWDLSQSQWMSN